MRKLLTIGLTLLLGAAFLSGCGQNNGTTVATTSETAGASQTASDTGNAENADEIFIWEGTVVKGLTEKGRAEASITIPDTATEIGKSACAGAKMTSLVIGANVQTIGNSAFKNCRSLESIAIPASVKKIEDRAFYMCDSVITVTFSEGLEEIGEESFSHISANTITLPEGLKVLGESAFDPAGIMSSFYIPASLETIPNGALQFGNYNATVYVKEGSWADLHFEEYIRLDSFTEEPVSKKAYY